MYRDSPSSKFIVSPRISCIVSIFPLLHLQEEEGEEEEPVINLDTDEYEEL